LISGAKKRAFQVRTKKKSCMFYMVLEIKTSAAANTSQKEPNENKHNRRRVSKLMCAIVHNAPRLL